MRGIISELLGKVTTIFDIIFYSTKLQNFFMLEPFNSI